MRFNPFSIRAISALVAWIGLATALHAEPATQPSADEGQPHISPEARTELDQLASAYANLKTLDLAGAVSADMDVAGEQQKHETPFTSSFQTPNKFRHAMEGDLLVGSTGEKTYVYQPSEKMYIQADAPEQKVAADELPGPIPELLRMQNPSLLLALASDANDLLTEEATEVTKLDDVALGDKSYTALHLAAPRGAVRILIDPESHLLRQMHIDMKQSLEQQGAQDVKKAELTVNYSGSVPDAPVQEGQFAWSPPAGARDAAAAQAAAAGGSDEHALTGQAAPDFTLPDMNDQQVKLADLKGSVVVLDFWATWCGPCVRALPHLDKIYQEKSPEGLKVYAINLREDKQKVQGFLTSHKLTLPVLLDGQGSVGQLYKVEGIPQTVVIGKDGVVSNVFVGFGPGGEEKLREAIDAAMK